VKKKDYLHLTSTAYNSYLVLEKIKERIALTVENDSINKKERMSFSNELVQYIYNSMYDRLTAGYFWEFFIYNICKDMEEYRFSECSSVSGYMISDEKEILELVDNNKIKTEVYKSISLLEHTFDAVRAFERLEDRISVEFRFLVVVSAVLHDFGKCESLKNKIINTKEERMVKHSVSSMLYVKHLQDLIAKTIGDCSDMEKAQLDLVEKIKQAVYHHHSEAKPKTIGNVVKKIDQSAREFEFENFRDSAPQEYTKYMEQCNDK